MRIERVLAADAYRDLYIVVHPDPILPHENEADEDTPETGYHGYVTRNLAHGSRGSILDGWYRQKRHIGVEQHRRLMLLAHSVCMMISRITHVEDELLPLAARLL